jgi:hypothetical protein
VIRAGQACTLSRMGSVQCDGKGPMGVMRDYAAGPTDMGIHRTKGVGSDPSPLAARASSVAACAGFCLLVLAAAWTCGCARVASTEHARLS